MSHSKKPLAEWKEDDIHKLLVDGNVSDLEDLEDSDDEYGYVDKMLQSIENDVPECQNIEAEEDEHFEEETVLESEAVDVEETSLPHTSHSTVLESKSKTKNLMNYLKIHNLRPKKNISWEGQVSQVMSHFEKDKFNLTSDEDSPVSYICRYISENVMQCMVVMTNIYALQKGIAQFKNTTLNEMKVFLGLHIIMGVLHYPRVRMYWDSLLGINLFKENMTVNRFYKLRNSLHLVNNLEIPGANKDIFFKVRPLFNAIQKRCHDIEVENSVCIDEQMIPFKGNISVKQYMKNKPNKWGIKKFLLCGKSGMMYDFLLFQGSSTQINEETKEYMGQNAAIVLKLTERLDRSGHQLYFDNLFNSYHLLQVLSSKGIQAAGTMRQNRFPNACSVIPDKALLKKPRGSVEERESQDGVKIVKWVDNKIVMMASNFIGKGIIDTVKRWSSRNKTYEQVPCPEVIQLYNKGMGGVDKMDFLIALYRIEIRTKKWTLKMIGHAIDLAITNSWLEYKRDLDILKIPKKDQLDLLHFRLYVAQALINANQRQPTRKRGRPCSSTSESSPGPSPRSSRESTPIRDVRLDGYGHLADMDDKSEATRCKMPNCQKKTHIFCTKCKTHLCLTKKNKCFLIFHTV